MDKVVYIIGAGFSAPLGIPVMGNFLFRSKDLYFSDVEKHSHFKQVFEIINKLSATKNYYDCDLFGKAGTDLFIPRVNGGYTYVLSRSVWVPMIIHWAAVSACVLCLGGRHRVLEL